MPNFRGFRRNCSLSESRRKNLTDKQAEGQWKVTVTGQSKLHHPRTNQTKDGLGSYHRVGNDSASQFRFNGHIDVGRKSGMAPGTT